VLRSLKAQTVAIVLAGLLVSNGIGLALYFRDRQDSLILQDAFDIAERAAGVSRLLRTIPDEWNPEIEAASDGRAFRVWSSRVAAFDNQAPTDEEEQLNADFRTKVPAIRNNEVRIWFRRSLPENFLIPMATDPNASAESDHVAGRWSMAISVHHGGDEWLNFYSQTAPSVELLPRFLVGNLLIALLVQSAIAVWLVARLTAPLQRMASAANRLGTHLRTAPIEQTGPTEIQLAARAFNSMQRKLIRHIESRTGMLTAISHDLRTPLTQVRLRTELSPPSEEREKTLAALDEMNAIIGTFLDYAKVSSSNEERALLDLGSLVESICDDFGDGGASITCDVREKVHFFGKRTALKRAFSNIVQNAVTHGSTTNVAVATEGNEVAILIEDNGPGIAAHDMEVVFQPFRRLDGSGSRDSEGFGLGLSIAQMIIEDHGGTISLHNRPERGLRVAIKLPKTTASLPGKPNGTGTRWGR